MKVARLGQRTDWFPIFHGILLEAFFAAPEYTARVIVGILGFLTSYLWFMTGYRQRRLGQPEVGVGLHPGGGGAERLPHLVGRGRALEIVLGANDFDGDTAERYGYVNRALADAELDGFVDALARRIASFDRRAIAAAKSLVNQVSLPSADRLLDALNSFQTALTWPEAQQRIQTLLERGLQRDSDFENRWPAVLGTLLET
jgi:1,4-dihydroxy-2-naphthoyl-CoA synthase